MQIAESADSLSEFLEQRYLVLERSNPVALCAALIDWYESERAQDAA